MKKSMLVLMAVMLCVSMLAGCGGEAEEPEVMPVEEDEPLLMTEPGPELEPENEPVSVPDGMITVEIINADFGDIIFSYPDDGSVTVTIAEPGAENDSLIPADEFRELLGVIIMNDNNVAFQRALIAGDDFNILVGYTDYYDGGNIYNTFGMVVNSKTTHGAQPLTYDGLNGILHYQHVATISFPAITQIAGRVILVFPNFIEEDDDVSEISRGLFEREDVQAILGTFRFPGEMLNEPRLETQPVDNQIFSITPADGWEVSAFSTMWHTYEFKKGDMRIETESSSSKPLTEPIDEYFNNSVYSSDLEELDNVTVNGQEFVVLRSERWGMFWLFTSRGGGPLDINGEGHFELIIRGANNLDDVMPLLNTLTVK